MVRKRKRGKEDLSNPTGSKKGKHQSTELYPSLVKTTILNQYYHKVLSLREYVLSQLTQDSAKFRRKKIASYGMTSFQDKHEDKVKTKEFSDFLDGTLVGVNKTSLLPAQDARQIIEKERIAFSQQVDATIASTCSKIGENASMLQSEVCTCISIVFAKVTNIRE